MKKNWPKVRLDELLQPISRPEAVDPTATYSVLGAHWYAKGLYTKDVLPGSAIQSKYMYRVKLGDFVYNRLFGWKGSFAIATDENDGCYVSNEFPCFETKRDLLNGMYLWGYFSLSAVWEEVVGLSTGGTPTSRNRLKEERLLAMEIPLPPLAEQQRLVARIETLTAQIHEAQTLRQQAAEEAEALLASARRLSFGDTPTLSSVPLGHFVAEIENGRSPQCESRPAATNEWGVLKVGAVSFGTFNDRQNKAVPLGLEFNSRHEVRPGDFLMSRANTAELVGACAIVGQTRPRLLLSDKTFRFHFRGDPEILPRWLDHAMKSPPLRNQIERQASGTSPTMKNISKEKVLGLLLPHHGITEQCQIVAYLDNLQEKTNALRALQAATSAELDALMPSILDKTFRGEL
jgi:type I restriction enzyme S subunit